MDTSPRVPRTRTYSDMVALGSSFAAGPGIEPVVDDKAMRSGRNYAHLVAEDLGAALTDATVSGATTATILEKKQRVSTTRFAPQIDAVRTSTDLVTITVGGNDLGYLGALLGCAAANRVAHRWYGRPAGWLFRKVLSKKDITDGLVSDTTDSVVRIIDEVRRRAPHARVVMVDYVPIVDDTTVPSDTVPLTAEEIAFARNVSATLSDIYLAAGAKTGAEIVSASSFESGHGTGAAQPWVHGFRPNGLLAGSFHPTTEGMRAAADLVLELLRRSDGTGNGSS
ncbi:SGNH/GDSL hydrolase family protein [Rhodococcoides fascians A25f]|uniref:SGNH/GDSL hydrolase family protein n=1 Tax=Rhodococcoides fascians TaxID=1828 RepID=UPI0012D2FB94|nr:SGNH/GDSL hydrolase family protein [Rhodococcus fascians]QII07794.1 SGNH/GDSL hydrolase family protein [Rhodococcus fascians A25f]